MIYFTVDDDNFYFISYICERFCIETSSNKLFYRIKENKNKNKDFRTISTKYNIDIIYD